MTLPQSGPDSGFWRDYAAPSQWAGAYPGSQQAGYSDPAQAGYPVQGQADGRYPVQAGFPASVAWQSYGQDPRPTRPGGVTAAAVLGFTFGGFGALISLISLVVRFTAVAVTGRPEDPGRPPSLDIEGVLVLVFALLYMAWTVLIIFGGVRALSGRSRVPLTVAGSIQIALFLSLLIAALTGSAAISAEPGSLVFILVFIGCAMLIVTLLIGSRASQFFPAARAQRQARGFPI